MPRWRSTSAPVTVASCWPPRRSAPTRSSSASTRTRPRWPTPPVGQRGAISATRCSSSQQPSTLPWALHRLAGSLTVHFPWGSLLRGVLGRDDGVLAGIAQLLAPGAAGAALVSVVPRDGIPPVPEPDELAAAYARHGLTLVEARPATREEVGASGSSWAKRLRAGAARPVTLLELEAARGQERRRQEAVGEQRR